MNRHTIYIISIRLFSTIPYSSFSFEYSFFIKDFNSNTNALLIPFLLKYYNYNKKLCITNKSLLYISFQVLPPKTNEKYIINCY